METMRVGVVGVGAQMLENLLPTLLQMPDVRIAAACDCESTRAQQIHRFINDVPITKSIDEMLSTTSVDALVVASPPQGHRDIALFAMRRGIHVFVEKPPCSTLFELEALIDLERRSNVVTGVGLNFRFAKPLRHLRDMTSTEQFGKTVHIQLNHYASKPRTPLWGLDSTLRSFLLAQAIHTIDLGVLFGDGDLQGVRSRVQRRDGCLLVNAELTFSSETTATILCGTMFPYFEFGMKLVTSNSTMVELDNLWNITLHEPDRGASAATAAKRWRSAWQPGPLDSGYERSGYYGELREFFEAIRTGASMEANFACLLPTYQIIETICKEDGETSATEPATGRPDVQQLPPALSF